MDKLRQTADLLLRIASLLMVSGANTNRINLSLTRFASAINCHAYTMVTHQSLILTVSNMETSETYTRVKKIPQYHINFLVISAISKASWSALNENWSMCKIEKEFNIIKSNTRYPRFLVLLMVSLAGAGFCNIFKGDYLNMGVAFVSTFIGLLILQSTLKARINRYIATFLASFIASCIASIGVIYSFGSHPQAALATSILFLVPGVPLINSFNDLLDNNILNGIVRFAYGALIVLSMALGLFIAMLLFRLN